jgi:hypothetical protein
MSSAVTYHFQGGQEVSLTGDKKTFTIDITPDSSTNAGILQFNCGNSTLPVYIDNVSLVKKSGSAVKRMAFTYKKNGIAFNYSGNRICWSSSSSKATASLVGLSGRIVKMAKTAGPFSLADVPSGHYLFVISDGVKKQSFRVFKQQ